MKPYRLKPYRSITWRLSALLVFAAILPLTVFGAIVIWQARSAARNAVLIGNIRLAERAADQIRQYVENSVAILRSTAENVSRADLKKWQRERVIRDMTLKFEELDEIVITGLDGSIEATSDVENSDLTALPFNHEAIESALKGSEYLSSVFITDEFTPAMIIAIPRRQLGEITGAVVARLDLIHMWRLADRIRVGEKGYVSVVAPTGKLIASGEGEMKRKVLQEKDYPDISSLGRFFKKPSSERFTFERNDSNGTMLVSGVTLPAPLSWTVVLEQPTAEAYALAKRLTCLFVFLVISFAAVMSLLGYIGGTSQIVRPVAQLISGTRKIAAGDLQHRVEIFSHDEFGELASSFNNMAGEVSHMQDNIRKQERMAVFGRVASGLIHDLKHPIQSIENVSRLMENMYGDAAYRKTFRNVVDREFTKINSFLENLHKLTHDIPFHPIRMKLHPLLDEVINSSAISAEKSGIAIVKSYGEGEPEIFADKFSLTRALSNIVNNAIQAMQNGGKLTVATSLEKKGEDSSRICISIADMGCGIPADRLNSIFSDFVTTKKQGLGLGLAVTKRIFEQHGAEVRIESEVGHGTKFDIFFERANK